VDMSQQSHSVRRWSEVWAHLLEDGDNHVVDGQIRSGADISIGQGLEDEQPVAPCEPAQPQSQS